MVFYFCDVMRKSGLLALCVALLIPLLGYWLIKYYGKDAAHLPGRYFYDSVAVKGNGKNDTIWHKVKDMHFTNQLGREVKLSDAEGKAIVMNFVFTRCPVVCPGLTRSMKKLQDSYVKNPGIVQFISVSVDPEHDSVANLRKFSDRFNVNHDNWWFVTGNKTEIYDFAIQEMKANIADPGIDTAFIHTEDFFLLDRDRVVRGWYSGFDTVELAKLARDIPALSLERDRSKSSLSRIIAPALPAVLAGVAVLFIVFLLFNRKKGKRDA